MQNARWSTAIAIAALVALPIAASAQSTQGAPPQNPPQQSQPPSQPPSQPAQPPAQQPPATAPPSTTTQPPAEQPPAAGQADATAAKQHLTQARESLSAITSMPEAAKLQGDARTQVSQLISNFNALITTQSEWRAAYAKVDENVTALLGPDAPADQPVGTSGNANLDPAIRAKLTEFRTHLKAFASAAGGATPTAEPGGAMPPAAATSSMTNPANPASAASPATPSKPDVSPSSPTAKMDAADRAKAAGDVSAAGSADAQKELDAISSILNASKTGALTKAQTTELKKHVETLRALIAQR